MSIAVVKIHNRKTLQCCELRDESWKNPEPGAKPLRMHWIGYTPRGEYIGDEKMTRYLLKRGIIPERISPEHNVCSVGFCVKEGKWYGWSHRAICGFGIRDRIFEEKYGNDKTLFVRHGRKTIKTWADAYEAACAFARSVS